MHKTFLSCYSCTLFNFHFKNMHVCLACKCLFLYVFFFHYFSEFHHLTLHAFLPQRVVAAERTRGGQLLEEPKMLPFQANTFNLQVSIQDVPQFLWSIKPFTTCQVGKPLLWCWKHRKHPS